MKHAIHTNNLTKQFGSTLALSEVSLSIHQGEVFALLGANGAGKSTLLQILSTLLKPTNGHALIAGYDVETEPLQVKKRIGMLFGNDTGLYSRLTARENIEFYADFYDVDKQEKKKRITSWSEQLHLTPYLDQPVGKLSKGNQQKVAILRTMIHDPEVLIFDEPTTGLDIEASFQFQDIVKQLQQKGKTILFSTHILEEVSELATSVGILQKGKLLFIGSLVNLYETKPSATLVEIIRSMIRRD